MTGNSLIDLFTELNGGASAGSTLTLTLLNIAKGIIEQNRPWMVLRATDTSKTVTTETWQTAISLATITRFSRFYGEQPIRLYDTQGSVIPYPLVPSHERLDHKDQNVCTYEPATQSLYLLGTRTLGGTLYLSHLKSTEDIAATDTATWTLFPTYAHPLLALYAVAAYKGGVDFDAINARMSPENKALADEILQLLIIWDNEMQLSEVNEPTMTGTYRSGTL